jgi:endogenous inhibitor of DNA gyrase (YacG/DUF329 family)
MAQCERKGCKKPVKRNERGRRKRFCSGACANKDWRSKHQVHYELREARTA